MKKLFTLASCMTLAAALTSCGGNQQKNEEAQAEAPATTTTELKIAAQPMGEETEALTLNVDNDGYITIFDGKTLNGWRGYGKSEVPARWVIEDGCLKFNGSGTGEGQTAEGGDLIFAHKFKNFELSFEYKISKGGNSGVFVLSQEVPAVDKDGKQVVKDGVAQFEPIYISAPEFQVLDNENHPDAKMGKDGNRKAGSLYDMIPATPQTSKPAGEWNTASIMVYQGTVLHTLNGENVVEYHLWTPKWTEMLQASKFSEEKWPTAFALLNNLGGDNHEGLIGLQDHGNDVWYRNIKVKVMD